MKNVVLAASLGITAVAPVSAEPFRFTETIDVNGIKLPLSLEVFLEAVGRTEIEVKVAGNLRALQQNISAILSEVITDTCEERLALEINSALPEGDMVRFGGRAQAIIYTCPSSGLKEDRQKFISVMADVGGLLEGRLEGQCMGFRLEELSLEPEGFVGDVMNLFDLTNSLTEEIRVELNKVFKTEKLCFDLPPFLKVLEPKFTGGGLRDFGNNELGFVVTSEIDLRAQGVLDLIALFPENEQDCACD